MVTFLLQYTLPLGYSEAFTSIGNISLKAVKSVSRIQPRVDSFSPSGKVMTPVTVIAGLVIACSFQPKAREVASM